MHMELSPLWEPKFLSNISGGLGMEQPLQSHHVVPSGWGRALRFRNLVRNWVGVSFLGRFLKRLEVGLGEVDPLGSLNPTIAVLGLAVMKGVPSGEEVGFCQSYMLGVVESDPVGEVGAGCHEGVDVGGVEAFTQGWLLW